jgi:hypothetical protein
MRGEIRNTAYCVALNLYVRAQHLADKRFQAAELDDEEFVVGVDGKVSESSTGSALNFGIVAAEEEGRGFPDRFR